MRTWSVSGWTRWLPGWTCGRCCGPGRPVGCMCWAGGGGSGGWVGAVAAGGDLGRVLRSGPAGGVHVLGWWGGQRRFGEDTGGSAAREDVAGLVLLDLPATDAALLTGEASLDWQPRPNRALRFDRHTARADVFVPFADPGRL